MSADPRRAVVESNLDAIQRTIAAACSRSGRDPSTVRLVAAAKTVDPREVAWVVESGVPDIGHNYVRELRAGRSAVPGATWHFIGTLQSGSANQVADLADVVETLVPGNAMRRLARRAAGSGRRLPALVEVDLAGRGTGVAPGLVPQAADEVAATEGLELAGLMTLPPLPADPEESRPYFRRLRELLSEVALRHPAATELSMGMSLDYGVAVEEGATMVRIGTALFGARPPADQGRT
jgi:hypothetical protein